MTTILLFILLVIIGLIYLAAWLVHGAWPMAIGALGHGVPTVIAIALLGTALMVMSQRRGTILPVARVLARRRFAKGDLV